MLLVRILMMVLPTVSIALLVSMRRILVLSTVSIALLVSMRRILVLLTVPFALLVRHRVNVLQRLVAAIAILLRPTSIIGIVIHHAVALPVQGTRKVAVWRIHHVHLLVQLVISFDLALA